jgi:hypothetical protein
MGAVAVLAARPLPDALLPVVVVPDLQAALGRLAAAFYERPAARMRTVGVVGSFGKTTTAWLARGMFEETNERCGMIGEWLGVALWEKAGGSRRSGPPAQCSTCGASSDSSTCTLAGP